MTAPSECPAELVAVSAESRTPYRWLWVLVLVLAAAAPYLPTFGYGFVYDDAPQIVDNRDLLSLQNIPKFFTQAISKSAGSSGGLQPVFYRPLFFSQLCVTRVLLGPGPFGFHLVSLLLHIGNTVLLFYVGLRLGLQRTTAYLAAMLFAVHPVHVETVVWPSASPELMVLAAILCSLLAFLKSRQTSGTAATSYGWLALSLLSFAAALFAKETALIALPVIAATAFFESSDRPSQIARSAVSLAPYLVIAFLYFLVRNRVLHGFVKTVTPISLLDMARTWPSALWFYVRHLVWPAHTSVLYDYDLVERATLSNFWFPFSVVLAAVAALGFFVWRHRSAASIVATLLLVLPLVLVLNFRVFYWRDLVHDRYLYIPSVGFCVIAAMALSEFGDWLAARIRRPVQYCMAAGLLCVLALAAVTEAQPWKNNMSLLRHAVAVAPGNIAAEILLGNELESKGNFTEARTCYERALQLTPGWAPAWFAFGRVLLLTHDPEGAVRSLRRAEELENSPIAQVWLALALDRVGQTREADALLAKAVAQDPSMLQTHLRLQQQLVAAMHY